MFCTECSRLRYLIMLCNIHEYKRMAEANSLGQSYDVKT